MVSYVTRHTLLNKLVELINESERNKKDDLTVMRSTTREEISYSQGTYP